MSRNLMSLGLVAGALVSAAVAGSFGAETPAAAQPVQDLQNEPAAVDACSRLASLKLDQLEIVSARTQPAGAPVQGANVQGMPGLGSGGPVSDAPAFCRIIGRLHPEPGSDIRFEVWMPSTGWNGRLNSAGNGGFAGTISYMELAQAVKAGQVGTSTDAGHSGNGIESAWARGHPEKVRDYGWRAVHLTAVVAKQIVSAFYGRGPDKSYFMSCSNGGRQALMAAARFPGDYDGILAGAPAASFADLVMTMTWGIQAQLPPGGALKTTQATFLRDEVVRQCDGIDGVSDGVIDDPRQCRIDLSKLACGASASPQCFSPPQIDALRRIYAGPSNSAGERISRPYLPAGAETGIPAYLGWESWIMRGGGLPSTPMLAKGLMTDIVAAPIATPDTFNFDRDPRLLRAALARDIEPGTNLTRFFARGGKLIMYHGWGDAAIPPELSTDYYSAALRRSGARAARSSRLFMIPAMQHCFAGPGPSDFGQLAAPKASDPPDGNIAAALQAWVETGRSPETIVGRFPTTYPVSPSTGARKERLICAWPAKAQLRSGADPDLAASYTCSKPSSSKSSGNT